jgi:hypothetical protein
VGEGGGSMCDSYPQRCYPQRPKIFFLLKGEDVSLGVARVFFCASGHGWLFVS